MNDVLDELDELEAKIYDFMLKNDGFISLETIRYTIFPWAHFDIFGDNIALDAELVRATDSLVERGLLEKWVSANGVISHHFRRLTIQEIAAKALAAKST